MRGDTFTLRIPTGSDDIRNIDLTKIHNLSGPIAIEGAEPGDCLVVDILDGKQPVLHPELIAHSE